MQSIFQKVSVDGGDIQRIILNQLAPALSDEPHAHKILAMLTFAVILEKPDIDADLLQDIVMSTSEHMALRMVPVHEGMAN